MSSKLLIVDDPLQYTLRRPSSTETFSRLIVKEIWDHHFTPNQYREYRKLYESYIIHIYQELSIAACSGDSQIPDFTHRQILEVVKTLKSQPWTKLEAARTFYLSTGCADEDRVTRAITLAAGLLVPLNFNCVGGVRRGEIVTWEDNDSLNQTLAKRVAMMTNQSMVPYNNCTLCNSTWAFPRNFNAKRLTYVTGFEIIWTNNFLDHLLVQDDNEKVKIYIFHHVKILENHLTLANPIIPPELISETFDTLALLIPRTDYRVRKWYTQFQESYILDPSVLTLDYLNPEARQIDHFVFWGSRLRKLKMAFDEHEPDGPLQWWRDDRKPVQWWTFWIAALVLVLTVVFGLVQPVTAILQLVGY